MCKRLFLVVMFILISYSISSATCYFNCAGIPGTECINDNCVPIGSVKPTPTPTPVPSPTPLPYVSNAMLFAIQKYCNESDKVCIVVLMVPTALNLTTPLKPVTP